jgi:hypothetical protein
VRYYPPSGDLFFDVMTRLRDAASFETVDAEIKQVDGIRVPVATRATGRWRHVRTPGAVVKFRTIEEAQIARARVSTARR